MCTYCGNSKFIEYDGGYRRLRHSSPRTIIDELKRIGLDTAKAVLNIEKDDLLKRSDLEEETVDNVRATLKKEFE